MRNTTKSNRPAESSSTERHRFSRFVQGISRAEIRKASNLDHEIFHLRLDLERERKDRRKHPTQLASARSLRLQRKLKVAEEARRHYPENLMEILECHGTPTRVWPPLSAASNLPQR
jgi:hypothetical protein